MLTLHAQERILVGVEVGHANRSCCLDDLVAWPSSRGNERQLSVWVDEKKAIVLLAAAARRPREPLGQAGQCVQ